MYYKEPVTIYDPIPEPECSVCRWVFTVRGINAPTGAAFIIGNGKSWEFFNSECVDSVTEKLVRNWLENGPAPLNIPEPHACQKHKCNCSNYDLFNFGCKCGGV